MRLVVYLPVVTSVLLGVTAPWLARLLPPRLGARLLIGAGAACAASTAFSLGALALTFLGQFPTVAGLGGWSAALLHQDDPVPLPTGQLATMAAAVILVTFLTAVVRHTMTLVRLRRAAPQPQPSSTGLVIVNDPQPQAYALPDLGAGRVVISTGMLRALRPPERRVLFAHERAHLRHRHHLYRMATVAIAALDPLLLTLPAAVRHLTERWADEDAATAVGDRRLTARAIARAALAAHHAPTLQGAVAIGEGDVPKRVRSLLAPRHGLGRGAVAALLAALVVCAGSTAEIGRDADDLFDLAATAPSALHAPQRSDRDVPRGDGQPLAGHTSDHRFTATAGGTVPISNRRSSSNSSGITAATPPPTTASSTGL